MGEQGGARHARSKDGGIREGRELVAEVGTSDDAACYPSVFKAVSLADAHERHTYRGHRSPGRPHRKADYGAEQAAADEKHLGTDDLHAIVDHRGDDARHHPRATDGPDEQQDDDGRGATGYLGSHLPLQVLPLETPAEMAYDHADGRCHEKRHLGGTIQCCVAKDGNATRDE